MTKKKAKQKNPLFGKKFQKASPRHGKGRSTNKEPARRQKKKNSKTKLAQKNSDGGEKKKKNPTK